jgi:hypothetical protein
MKKPGTRPGFVINFPPQNYFCCSLGLSAGFGGLFWVCCCGVAGVGFAGFCGSDAEIVTFVMVISFHEKKDSNFQYHRNWASRANKQGKAPVYFPEFGKRWCQLKIVSAQMAVPSRWPLGVASDRWPPVLV